MSGRTVWLFRHQRGKGPNRRVSSRWSRRRRSLKPVKPGLREGDLIEVEGDGVEADKAVVTDGAYGLIMTQQFATKIRVVNE